MGSERPTVGEREVAGRRELAGNPGTPAEVLITLLDDSDFHVRWEAAQNPSADERVQLAALAGKYPDVAEAVAQLGDALTAEVVAMVLAHARPRVREQLALSTSSPALLLWLSADPAPSVRAAAASSEHADEALLRRLAVDPRARVRAAAAATASASMPRDVVEVLATDRSVEVRFWVSSSRHYDAELAARQWDDPDEPIRRHARTRVTGKPPEAGSGLPG